MMEVATAPQRGASFAILNSRAGLFAEARSEVMMKVATAPQRGARLWRMAAGPGWPEMN